MRVVQIGIKMLLAVPAQAAGWNLIMAGSIIAMIPPSIIVSMTRSSLVKGFATAEEK